MVFKKINGPSAAAAYVADTVSKRLIAGQKVLWLVPGGSAAEVAAMAAERLRRKTPLQKLTVTLTDERYGPVNHVDSNWRQLMGSSFDLPSATFIPALSGLDLTVTAELYGLALRDELRTADYSLALAGMGPDGHIFGIMPGSPAVKSAQDVVGYEWTDYTRLTTTLSLLKKLDEVVIYAVGEPKWPQIAKLKEDLSVSEQPAQILKRLPRVIFFNDYQGERA